MSGIVIRVLSKKPEIIDKLPAYWGLLEINDINDGRFDESFVMPITWWSREDYEQQWQEGLKRIKDMNTSCLVTSVQLLFNNPYINRWVLYKENEVIHVQNQILVDDNFRELYSDKPFNLETCYDGIGPRRTKSESGFDISEWSFSLQQLKG